MLLLLAFLAVAPASAPAEPLAGQLRAALWYDLGVNAFIGNGNWLASIWYNAGSDTMPNLHIRELRCGGNGAIRRCSFMLLRDGGAAKVFGEEAPDKLACDAALIRVKGEDGWEVKHTPPGRTGHSQTTMQCKASAG